MAKHRRLRQFRPEKKAATAGASQLLLDISDIAADGRGVARHNNKVVFVEGALSGERVEAKLVHTSRRFDEATITEVLQASPERVTPGCQHFGHCGGCQLQHLSIGGQRKHKQAQLHQLLERAQQPLPEITMLAGDERAYRHRLRLAFAVKKGVLRIGFREQGSHQIVDLQACPVVDEALFARVAAGTDALQSFLMPLKTGELLFAIDAGGRVGLAIRAEKAATVTACEQLSKTLAQQSVELFSVASSQKSLWSPESPRPLTYPLALEPFGFLPSDFTQANPRVNLLMQEQVLRWLEPGGDDVIGDFFCGLGNFSLPLASHCRRLIGYELDADMVARAGQNAKARQMLNCEFEQCDLFASAGKLEGSLNKVLLDPPRAGAEQLVQRIARTSAIQRVVYVSCDPKTLARDARLLCDAGFSIDAAALGDMFPHTRHIESLLLLNRH